MLAYDDELVRAAMIDILSEQEFRGAEVAVFPFVRLRRSALPAPRLLPTDVRL
jgi:hypothetical protein